MSCGAVILALPNSATATDPPWLLDVADTSVCRRILSQLERPEVGAISILTTAGCEQGLAAEIARWDGETLLESAGDGAAFFEVLAELASDADAQARPLLVVPAGTVMHGTLVSWLTTGDVTSTAALVSPDALAHATTVTVAGDMVVDASASADPLAPGNGWAMGPLRVGTRDLASLASVASHIAATSTQGELTCDSTELVLVGLIRAGVPVAAVHPRGLSCVVVESPAEAAQASDAVTDADEEERLRLDAAVKLDDNFWTTFFISPWTKHVARRLHRWGVAPNTVTVIGFLATVAAALLFSVDQLAAVVVAALLVQVSFALDCVDGQLARYGRRMTAVGAWLDWNLDRLKEPALIVGLTVGAGHDATDAWVLGSLALSLLCVRSLLVQSYAVDLPTLEAWRAEQIGEGVHASPPWGRRKGGWAHWIRYVVIGFPYADRLAVITVAALIGGPYFTLVVLVGWNAFSLAAQALGRLWRNGASEATSGVLRDDGPLARLARSGLPTLPAVIAPVAVAATTAALLTWPDQLWLPPICFAVLVVLCSARTGPPLWLGAPVTAAAELGAIVAATAAVDGRGDWATIAAAAVVVVVRAGAVTQQRFGVGLEGSRFGWEMRVAALFVGWTLDSIALGGLLVCLLGVTQYALDTVRSAHDLRAPAPATPRGSAGARDL